MRFAADSGLWSTGTAVAPTPLIAVLEVSGAVLSWTVDDPAREPAQITFTDVTRADWLWRVFGETGHVLLAGTLDGSAGETHRIELSGIDLVPGSVDSLRRLAVGHWLRRWWPASRRDGIPGLDRALLDVEVALLTAGAQGFFTDDTLDSDVAQLLAPHAAALLPYARGGDARITDLVRAGANLADDVGVDDVGWPELHAALENSSLVPTVAGGHRDDYALAAGSGTDAPGAAPIARGLASIDWSGVPPAIFDAAEGTVDWSVQAGGTAATAVIRAAVVGPHPATGVTVQLRSGSVAGIGTLDADGRATLELLDERQRPLTEHAAWDHDWPATSIVVGAPVSPETESREARERVRRLARQRIDRPGDDAFLAEILAAESAY
jgi:hypothetical protein